MRSRRWHHLLLVLSHDSLVCHLIYSGLRLFSIIGVCKLLCEFSNPTLADLRPWSLFKLIYIVNWSLRLIQGSSASGTWVIRKVRRFGWVQRMVIWLWASFHYNSCSFCRARLRHSIYDFQWRLRFGIGSRFDNRFYWLLYSFSNIWLQRLLHDWFRLISTLEVWDARHHIGKFALEV